MSQKFRTGGLFFTLIFSFLISANAYAQINFLAQLSPNVSKTSRFLSHSDFALRIEKVRQVKIILKEMSVMRANFLGSGDFIDIFPTVYYHVTNNELELILSDKLENPVEVMNLMLYFYDSYSANRAAFLKNGIEEVEPQWRDFYAKAIKANEYRKKPAHIFKPLNMLRTVQSVLISGFEGHIIYDLPRAVRKLTQTSTASKDSLRRDFRASDPVMNRAAAFSNRDISRSIFRRTRLFAKFSLNYGQKIFSVMPKVMKMRREAWDLGASELPLNTIIEQPILLHEDKDDELFNQANYLKSLLFQRNESVRIAPS